MEAEAGTANITANKSSQKLCLQHKKNCLTNALFTNWPIKLGVVFNSISPSIGISDLHLLKDKYTGILIIPALNIQLPIYSTKRLSAGC